MLALQLFLNYSCALHALFKFCIHFTAKETTKDGVRPACEGVQKVQGFQQTCTLWALPAGRGSKSLCFYN